MSVSWYRWWRIEECDSDGAWLERELQRTPEPVDRQIHRPRRRRAQQGSRRQSKPELVLIQQKSCADTLRLGSHAELGWWCGPLHCPGPDTLDRELDLFADVVDAASMSTPYPMTPERSSNGLADLPAVVLDPRPGRRARQGIPPEVRPEQAAPTTAAVRHASSTHLAIETTEARGSCTVHSRANVPTHPP